MLLIIEDCALTNIWEAGRALQDIDLILFLNGLYCSDLNIFIQPKIFENILTLINSDDAENKLYSLDGQAKHTVTALRNIYQVSMN